MPGPAAASGPAQTAAPSPGLDQVSAGDEPEWRAFAQAIAGPESGGKFNVRYTPKGGTTFSDYSKHPNIPEPGPEGPSTAAGFAQFTNSTWNGLPEDIRPDFQPSTQYNAFKFLAERDYANNTGRDLVADLKAGKLDDIKRGLQGTWPTIGKAMSAYPTLLSNYTRTGAQTDNATPAQSSLTMMPDTSLAGAGDRVRAAFGGAPPTSTGNGMASAIAPVTAPQPQGSGMGPLASLLGGGGGSPYAPSPTASSATAAPFGSPVPAPTQLAQNGPLTALPSQGGSAAQSDPTAVSHQVTPNLYWDAQAGMLKSGTLPSAAGRPVPAAPQAPAAPFGSLAPQMPAVPTAPPPGTVSPSMMPATGTPFGSPAPAPPAQTSGAGMPGLNPAYVAWAQQQDRLNAALGRRNPTTIDEALKMALSGSPQFQAAVEAAKKGATAPIDLQYAGPMASAQAWAKVAPSLAEKWNSPMDVRAVPAAESSARCRRCSG